MNKIFFYIVLVFLALSITLTAVYFLNLGNIKQIPASNDSRMSETDSLNIDKSSNEENNKLENGTYMESSKLEETPPSNFKDQELIDLEKELNSLDLSSENDIE
jgi:hypothetical protein